MFQVDVFVSAIDNLKYSLAFLSEANSGQDQIRLIEIEGGEAGFGIDWHFHVASRDVDFCLIDEKFEIFLVLAWSLG